MRVGAAYAALGAFRKFGAAEQLAHWRTARDLSKAGVAINPATPVSAIEHVIDNVDLILVMSVNPGFGGQSFIPDAVPKLKQAKALIGGRKIDLEVDGGINPETAALVAKAGANVLVAGNAIFAGNDAKTYTPRIKAIRAGASSIKA